MKNIISVSKLSLCLLLVIALACESQPSSSQKKLVVINIRGTSYHDLMKYIEINPRGFLSKMAERNEVTYLKPVANAVTATNWAAFETGVQPQKNGIIGHQFGKRVEDSLLLVSGFNLPYQVPSFLEEADRAGKKVLNIGSLLLHGAFLEHEHLLNVAQGRALSNPQLITLDQPSQRIEILDGQFIHIRLSTSGYHIDRDSVALNGDLGILKNNEWAQVELDDYQGLKIATRIKLMKAADGPPALFIRSVFVNRGYPKDFLQNLENSHGPSRGWPSLGHYFGGIIDTITVKEEINSEIKYLLDIYHEQVGKGKLDLIVTDYPLIDRYGHIFSIDFEQQHTIEAYKKMETDLERMVKIAQKNGYLVLIQSGHGFSKIHTQVNLNRIISEQTRLSQNTTIIPGKVSANIYFDKAASKETKDEVFSFLQGLRDDRTELTIIDQVWRNEGLTLHGLQHANTGDLFVLLKPGYIFTTSSSSEQAIFSGTDFKGDHGYLSTHSGNEGVLIHSGLQIASDTISILDLYPTILDYLRVDSGGRSDGNSLIKR